MYGSLSDGASSSLSNVFPDVTKQDTTRDVRELRDTFAAGATLDLAQRRTLLQQLDRLLIEGEDAIKEAMWRDLHKHPMESYVYEIAATRNELQEHLDYLEDWAAPTKVATNAANMPGQSYIRRDPLGVVCIIGTWNYPIALTIMPLVSAIAAGNCAVVRLPGDDAAPYINNVLIALFDKYLDKRFVRYVYGGVEETKAMLRERYDLLFATGSCNLGKIVAQAGANHLTPVVLELGGKSPAIIDDSADIEMTARRLAWGAFTNAGQTCVRPDYVLVDEHVGDKLVASVEKHIVQFYGKDAQQSDGYGRIVNARMFQRLEDVLQQDKCSITYGGAMDAADKYIEPTVLNFKTDLKGFKSSAVMAGELFGPIMPVYYYPTGRLQAAIDYVRQQEKPLALHVFSTDTTNMETVATQTSSGSMVINDTIMQLTNTNLPFGGVGMSGSGSYHGRAGFNTFSHAKSVLRKYSLMDSPHRYAPYTPETVQTMRKLAQPWSRKHVRTLKGALVAVPLAAIGLGFAAFAK